MLWGVFVMRIERETTADHAVARGGRAVAEGAADALGLEIASAKRVDRQIPVAQYHSPQADKIGPPFAHRCLRDMREIFLQVRVPRSDEDAVRAVALENPRR